MLVSAAAFGAAYNLIVALQTIWSARVFADRPAVGLGAVLFVLSVGLLAGPPLAGALADGASLSAAFYAAARSIYLDEPHGENGFWTRLAELEPRSMFIWGRRDTLAGDRELDSA